MLNLGRRLLQPWRLRQRLQRRTRADCCLATPVCVRRTAAAAGPTTKSDADIALPISWLLRFTLPVCHAHTQSAAAAAAMYASAVAAVAVLAGSASAFVAPSTFNGAALQTTAKPSTAAMQMSAEAMLGADVETGGVCE